MQPLWRIVWKVLKKLKIELLCDPAIPLLGIYQEKPITQKDKCTSTFIAVIFTIAKMWKQLMCPSTGEWIKLLWYIYTMKCYKTLKMNETMPLAAPWVELDIIILSQVSQKEKDKYNMISLLCRILQNDTHDLIYKIEMDSQT